VNLGRIDERVTNFFSLLQVCNMMTVSELHRRYHDDTGIVFSSMYPGCIAETALFREKRTWFRKVSVAIVIKVVLPKLNEY
jgi:hypothetical protein